MKLNNNLTMKNANIREHTKQETLTYKINNLHTAKVISTATEQTFT